MAIIGKWNTLMAVEITPMGLMLNGGEHGQILAPSKYLPEDAEPGETTHLCTADDQGTVVSLTQSIQSLFGAKVANAELGFLYNNCLTTCPRHDHPYQLAGRCLPRSNMAPTPP